MGLAQQIERPRNWDMPNSILQASLDIGENGHFLQVGEVVNSNNEPLRSLRFPYDYVIERYFVNFASNALDGGSVNTITLRVNGSDTTAIMTLTDASPIATLVEITGLAELVPAGQAMTFRWNSNSTGAIGFRGIGYSCRIVNPIA